MEKKFQIVSYQDLARATDGFSSANMIGDGRYGSVYKGILGPAGQTVAIKVLNLNSEEPTVLLWLNVKH
jgi:hypothetical protein